MPDPSLLPYVAMGSCFALMAVICLAMGLSGATPLLFVSLFTAGFAIATPIAYKSDVAVIEWVRSLDESAAKRNLSRSELSRFGPDAVGGVIYGSAGSSSRLYCVNYFDGSLGATLGSRSASGLNVLEGIPDICRQ